MVKLNCFNITVLWIHHLTALQEHGVVMQNLLHLHLNLTAWQVEHMLCLNGRQPGANIQIKIEMMITGDKSTPVMLLHLLKIFTGDKLKTLQTMTPGFTVPQTSCCHCPECVATPEITTNNSPYPYSYYYYLLLLA
jgi:hypothetical protein